MILLNNYCAFRWFLFTTLMILTCLAMSAGIDLGMNFNASSPLYSGNYTTVVAPKILQKQKILKTEISQQHFITVY